MAVARTNNYAVLYSILLYLHAILIIHLLASARTALFRTIHLRGYNYTYILVLCFSHSLYTRVALARTNLLSMIKHYALFSCGLTSPIAHMALAIGQIIMQSYLILLCACYTNYSLAGLG